MDRSPYNPNYVVDDMVKYECLPCCRETLMRCYSRIEYYRRMAAGAKIEAEALELKRLMEDIKKLLREEVEWR